MSTTAKEQQSNDSSNDDANSRQQMGRWLNNTLVANTHTPIYCTIV